MNQDSQFYRQAELMLRVLPIVYREKCFALKGGTAINFFIRDMPRLSVDIDLTYLPLDTRSIALTNISDALKNISSGVKRALPGTKVYETRDKSGTRISKLVVSPGFNQVKIEPNEILRGVLYKEGDRDAAKTVQKMFEVAATARCVSIADLYGGKLCALLDRQHPRDMFDVMDLLANEGITPEIRRAFVVYLAGHNRPMHELLDPKFKDMESVYEKEFIGMTRKQIPYRKLSEARSECLENIRKSLDDREKQFLLSIMEEEPAWNVLGIPRLEELPWLRWKIQNVGKMAVRKREESISALKAALDI